MKKPVLILMRYLLFIFSTILTACLQAQQPPPPRSGGQGKELPMQGQGEQNSPQRPGMQQKQTSPPDSTAKEAMDSVVAVPKRFLTPSIYIDYGKMLTLISNFETKYEGGIELLINEQFPICLEVGLATITPESAFSNGDYESSGMYYRIGAGYVSQWNPKNKLGIGFRYGSSVFDESARIQLESPTGIQEPEIITVEEKDQSASWGEIVVYSDRKLNNFLSIGLNLRLKILAQYSPNEPIDVYAIPGYGRSFEKTNPGANLFFKISF